MVNGLTTNFDDIADELVIAVLVGFEGFVSGWDCEENKGPNGDRVSIRVDGSQTLTCLCAGGVGRQDLEPVCRKINVRRRDDDRQGGIRLQ